MKYVGRTKYVARREKEHKKHEYKKDLDLEVVNKNQKLTLYEARGLEHILIRRLNTYKPGPNNPLNNQIRGISPNNGNRKYYLKDAAELLGEETYVGGYEW